MAETNEIIALPEPSFTGPNSLEQVLAHRRSVRDYQDSTIELAGIGQLLWAAQGITHARGLRTAPSAGALYPLEIYVVTGRADGLPAGVYHYDSKHHQLMKTLDQDKRSALAAAAYSQDWIKKAPVIFVFTAAFERTMKKYSQRGVRYVHIEAGHAAQNLFLQSQALGLSSVVVGAFVDDAVSRSLQLPPDIQPLLLMPAGHKR
jgi:SagB-type dehydrogenase family enzyme